MDWLKHCFDVAWAIRLAMMVKAACTFKKNLTCKHQRSQQMRSDLKLFKTAVLVCFACAKLKQQTLAQAKTLMRQSGQ